MAIDQDFQPLLEAQQQQLGLTFTASDTLDMKALALLAANIAIIIYSLQSLSGVPWWLLVPMYFSFAASIASNFKGFWPRNYTGPGVNLQKHPEYLIAEKQELLLQLISDTTQAINLNMAANNNKWNWLLGSFGYFGAGTLLVVACILYV